MRRSKNGFSPAHLVDAMDANMDDAAQAGALMHTAGAGDGAGRRITIGEQPLLNFGGCSYLGLERHPDLIAGAHRALELYGTQFSFSRAFVQLPLYCELEELLARMTGGNAVVAPTTSLGHISALPAIVESGDAVLIDQSAHASVHTAVALLRRDVVVVRHGRMELLERQLAKAASCHKRVWYLLDGLYSMLGDLASMDVLNALLEKYPELHLYVDDAHSTSWTGTHGRGHALERLKDRSRVIVALSLNKAFAAAGGCLVFPTTELADRVKRAGGPMVFAGPIQPPLLGAAVASAGLHLSPELPRLQHALMERIKRVVSLAEELGVPLADKTLSPIFFVQCGDTNRTFELVRALRARGAFVCAAMFPIVPINQAGIRFTVSLHNKPEDIDLLLHAIADELRRLSGSGTSRERTPSSDAPVEEFA